MNFLIVITVIHSTLLIRNEIDNVNGMSLRNDGNSTQDDLPEPSNPWKTRSQKKSYASAVIVGPKPIKPQKDTTTPSKRALQNQKKRERRKLKKADEESSSTISPSRSVGDPEEFASVIKETSDKVARKESSLGPTKSKTEASAEKFSSPLKQSTIHLSTQDELDFNDFPALPSHGAATYPQKMNGSKRITSKTDALEDKMPKETQQKQLTDAMRDLLERNTSSVEGNRGKEAQDDSGAQIAPAETSHAPRNNKLKRGKLETDEREKIQSQKLTEKPEVHLEAAQDDVVDHSAFPSEPAKPTSQQETAETSKIESDQDIEELVRPQRYRPKFRAPVKYVEEIAPPRRAPAAAGSSRIGARRFNQEVPKDDNYKGSRKMSFSQFVNKEASGKDKFEGGQTSVQDFKNVQWQNREFHELQKNRKAGETFQRRNDSEVLSVDKRLPTENIIDLKSRSSPQEKDACNLKTCEDEAKAQQETDENDEQTDKSVEDRTVDSSQMSASLLKEAGPSNLIANKNMKEQINRKSSIVQNEEQTVSNGKRTSLEAQDLITHAPFARTLPTISNIESGPSRAQKWRDMSSGTEDKEKGEFTTGSSREKESNVSPETVLHPTVKTIVLDETKPAVTQHEGQQKEMERIKSPGLKEEESSIERVVSSQNIENVTAEGEIGVVLPHPGIDASTSEKCDKDTRRRETDKSRLNVLISELAPQDSSNTFESSQEQMASHSPEDYKRKKLDLKGSLPTDIRKSARETVTLQEATRNLQSHLKEVGIFHPPGQREQENSQQHEILGTKPISTSSLEICESTKDSLATESLKIPKEGEPNVKLKIRNPNSIHITPQKGTLKNTLLITYITKQAVIKLEQSPINPVDLGATDMVPLRDSGIIVKFDSSKGVEGLQKIISNTRNLNRMLIMNSIYVSKHLLCVHDVPIEVSDLQIMFTIRLQYHETPISVHFVPYSPDVKNMYKIALLDVGDSLLDSVKKNARIQIRWMWRRIDICVSPDQQYFNFSAKIDTRTPQQYTNEAFILKVPQNITPAEISQSVFKKYNERPYRIQFDPYISLNDMKIVRLQISGTLLKKVSLSPDIQIRWSERHIITNVLLDRCIKCQRLGHTHVSCRENTRPPPSPHENCVDCSSYHFQPFTPDIQPQHMTNSAECPIKLQCILKCIHEQMRRPDFIRNTPGPGWSRESEIQSRKTSQYLNRPLKRPETLQYSSRPSLEQPKRRIVHQKSPSSSSMNPSQVHPSMDPEKTMKLMKRLTDVSLDGGQPPITYLQAAFSIPTHEIRNHDEFSTKNNIPKPSEAGPSHMKSSSSAQRHDHQKLVNSLLPPDACKSMFAARTAGPEPQSERSKKELISEAVRQSVCETLLKVLPSFYETLLEAVDQSIQDTLFRLLPSTTYKSSKSQDWSSLASEDDHLFDNNEKEKETVTEEDAEENIPYMSVVLVETTSKKMNVSEELANADIDWKQAHLERSVEYPPHRFLFVCKSSDGAKYLQSVIKKSSNLRVLG